MYCWIWLKGSQIIHTCYILFIWKGQTSFSKITQVNWKSRSLRTSWKETSADMEKTGSYFNSYKVGENKYGSYSDSYNYFLHFEFFSWNIKNQIVFQKSKYCPDSWRNRKRIAQLDTPVNIQINYVKLSGFTFRLDVTKFLRWGKFFNPENSYAVFYEQPYTLPPFPCL